MSTINSVGIADLPFNFNQQEVKDFARTLFSSKRKDIEKMITVFDNAMILNRHFVHPRDWFDNDKSFVERSDSFLVNARSFSIKAVNNCIDNANAEINDIDHIIFVSSTGVATPTIDALLINDLKLNNNIKRTPIWGLGCVGGAVGISRAYEYTKAYPNEAVLLVAVEFCSLAFQKNDFSKSNIVAVALFSDGVAASLITGEEHRLSPNSRIKVLDTLTTTYYDSLDVMGWEVVENGFKAIFSKDIPNIVRNNVRDSIDQLVKKNNLKIEDLKHFIAHPGGQKVLNEYEKSLGLTNGSFKYSRKVLEEHGNMSSVTVLYVLKEFIENGEYKPGEYGIITALGPGFTSELLLFQIV